ncbi:MAG TPA: hypothetical protein VGB85_23520 [Nannocystis sp.]
MGEPADAITLGAKEHSMFALSTLSILTVVMCFNLALLLSLGLYLQEQRHAAPPQR